MTPGQPASRDILPANFCLSWSRKMSRARQQGAVAVIVALTLVVMLLLIGFALDTARLYNRKVELHNLADAAALAAAGQLNGTAAGITAANTVAAATVATARYQYNSREVVWSNSALQFSTSPPPDASWTDAGTAAASPKTVFYVRVDASKLGSDIRTVSTIFIHLLGASQQNISLDHVAIAGRTSINVTPLAICALSPLAAAQRTHAGATPLMELIEFGFRRGISYDLTKLNPGGGAGKTFVIDPITQPGKVAGSTHTSASMVSPFVCSGTMWMPHLAGLITVDSPFPLASLHMSLNSRFGDYDGTCKPGGSPPDFNVKHYTWNGGAAWMSSSILGQGATSLDSDGKLWTIADPDPTPSGNTPASYGPLWAYARAVPYSSYQNSSTEPAAGYASFMTSSLSTLYKPGITFSGYPTSGTAPTPYLTSSGTHFTGPSAPYTLLGTRQRRVLNIPLLSCPLSAEDGGRATVLGIGKFFMTVPATSTSIHAEFGGVLTTASSGGKVELL